MKIIKCFRDRTKNELILCRSKITNLEEEIVSLKRELNDVKFEKAKLEQTKRYNYDSLNIYIEYTKMCQKVCT